jgi:putative FmdB family regulatory protein
MLLMDFRCDACGTEFEELVDSGTEVFKCPECDGLAERTFAKAAHLCTVIVPNYPGCKRQKAGYTHTSHADQKATRIQSGYGGCQAPK